MSVMIGTHFSWFEMLRSTEAEVAHIDNVPPDGKAALVRARLTSLVAGVLDPLREALGAPVRISSGFRCKELNTLIGGHPQSSHLSGRAIDCSVSGCPSIALVALIRMLGLPYHKLIWYHPTRGGHVHITLAITPDEQGTVYYAPEGGGYVEQVVY